MVEELYIFDKNGIRRSVDINTPSGITLKWVSNMFNSLDKVNCSYSYTFKIPMTRHNREVFDFAEDIRHTSGLLGKKLKAEFIQNGIPLFRNGNLYIDKSTADSYSCVFTWDVIEGLQKLKDDSCSLNELRDALVKAGYKNDELVQGKGYIGWSADPLVDGKWNETELPYSNYDNSVKVYRAFYSAGIKARSYDDANPTLSIRQPYSDNDQIYNTSVINDLTPKAIMPVKYIIDRINDAFGTKFDICNSINGSNLYKEQLYKWIFKGSNLLDFGVLPLTGNSLTENQQKVFSRELKMDAIVGDWGGSFLAGFFKEGRILGTDRTLVFDISGVSEDKTYNGYAQMPISYVYAIRYNESGESLRYDFPSSFQVLMDNYIGWKYPSYMNISSTYNPSIHACIGIQSNYAVKLTGSFRVKTNVKMIVGKEEETMVKLNVYSFKVTDNQTVERVDITSIKPISVVVGSDELIYDFNMNDDEGFNAQILENTENGGANFFWFGFSQRITSFEQLTDFKAVAQINDDDKHSHIIDTFTNLPDIDCLAFMKSLFYMLGSFPNVKSDQTIIAKKYSEIKDNLRKQNILDWSKKILGNGDDDKEINYNASDFKQNNYYMSKWDDLSRTTSDLLDEENVYEDGIGNIKVEDNTLDKEQTVQQIPFYPPYILNRKHPKLPTGSTIKIWDLDNSDQEITWSGNYLQRKELQRTTEAQPAYGYVHRIPYMEDERDKLIPWSTSGVLNIKEVRAMRMSVMNPFKDIMMNPSYRYLQKIVEHPFVITEKLLLNEFDLMDIDYVKPVYLEKYNSYFAIISIQRDSKGVCKCELIKLPTYQSPVKVTLSFESQFAKFLHYKVSSTSKEDKTIMIGFIIENSKDGQYVQHSKVNLKGDSFQIFNPTSNTNWVIKDVWLDHYEEGDYNDYEFQIG